MFKDSRVGNSVMEELGKLLEVSWGWEQLIKHPCFSALHKERACSFLPLPR